MLKEKGESVKVAVRCRPLSDKEIAQKRINIVTVDYKMSSVNISNPENQKESKTYSYDHVYDEKSLQETIFKQTAKPILESVIEGYNGTIFAYGQTGTGKTFTMEGSDKREEDKGIIPRSISSIFNAIKTISDQQFLVQVSFIEIYNEEVRDLLNKNIHNKLKVRDKEGVFFVEDCKKLKVESAEQMLAILNAGRLNRAKGETDMNKDSSRSHSLFTIIIENSSVDSTGETHYRMGKLNLVDLAGSERLSKTNATGQRVEEAKFINLSLHMLGIVISKLVSGNEKHIPYRDSVLTKLLSDSLGGNTKTIMIANIGPADYNYDESLNTLRYAWDAKKIKNKPRINEDPKDAILRKFQEEIEVLKQELAKRTGKVYTGKPGEIQETYVDDEAAMNRMVDNLEKEKDDFRLEHEKEILKIKEQQNMATEEKKKLIEKLNSEIDENKKKKDEAKQILVKYREMKKKVLNSEYTQMKIKEQENEINKHRENLQRKLKEEKKLQEQLEQQAKKTIELKKKYESHQANIDDLNDKIVMLRQRIEECKTENKDNEEKLSRELINLQDDIKVILVDNMKKDFILQNFVPSEEREKITKCIEYNEKKGCYFINKIQAIKNNYKSNRETLLKMKKGKFDTFNNIDTFKNEGLQTEEQIINLRLEMPENMVTNFKGEQNETICKEIEHVLRDDDSDLLYWNKELNIFENNVSENTIFGKEIEKKSESLNTTANSVNTKDNGALKIRIGTAKKK